MSEEMEAFRALVAARRKRLRNFRYHLMAYAILIPLLLIANILAGPLVELAPSFARSVAPRGNLLLAGLLAGEQEDAVRRAYKSAGFAPRARAQRGDWAILWMRRRAWWRLSGRERSRLGWGS